MVVDFVIPFDSFRKFTGEIFGSSKNYYICCSHSEMCLCAVFAICYLPVHNARHETQVDLARFLCVLVSASRRFNAANDCDNTQNSQLL